MKHFFIIFISLLLGLGIFAFDSNSEAGISSANHEEDIRSEELSGLWADSNSTSFKNGYVIFSVEGNQVEMMHYLEFKGQPLVEKGRGRIIGRKLDYFVVVTRPIPGWAVTGEHFLTLSPDGKTLRGAYEDEKGNLGKLVFKKIGK